MKRLASQIVGLPITVEGAMRPVAHVSGLLMHPENGQILAFLAGYLRVLTPLDVEQWKEDRLVIQSPEDLVAPTELLRLREFKIRRLFLTGKKVYSASGKRLGKVVDFTVDTQANRLSSLEVNKHFLFWTWDARIFSAGDIREVTERAIFLTVEPEQGQKVKQAAPLTVTT